MRSTRLRAAVSFNIVLWFLLQCAPAIRAQNPGVSFSISPNEFRAGQPASALLSVGSNSPSLMLSTGDKFTFFFDSSVGTVSSVLPAVSVNSSSLAASDFSASFTATQVVVTYNGASKPFSFGSTVAVEVHFTAGGQVGTGKMSFSSRFTGSVNGNLPYTTVSIGDFANGGVTSVAHDPTLSGDGTFSSPLGVVPGSVPIATDATTLTGNGTAAMPLGVKPGSLPVATDATTLTGNGTSASPLGVNPAFVTNLRESAAQMGSKRAALRQFWTTQGAASLGLTNVGSGPLLVESDGADLWVANLDTNTVSRVRASDGSLLGTWTGATAASGVLVAMGKVFVSGGIRSLYEIDPTMAPGVVTVVTSALGLGPQGIAFDGANIWTANFGLGPGSGSVSKVTVNPLSVTNITTGFSQPRGILFDGSNIWVTDQGDNKLKQLDGSGNIMQSITVGNVPFFPAFDGTNIWVPNAGDNSFTVVRASTGVVLATLTGNGLNLPTQAAFDGQRIVVTNQLGHSVSLWKASDLTSLGSFATGTSTFPFGACSDGVNFWITLFNTNQLARF